jgi:3-isopropylmalate dehydratase small subunit
MRTSSIILNRFARSFYRNAINSGLGPVECDNTYGGPKRCRYSVEEINAFTISAAM